MLYPVRYCDWPDQTDFAAVAALWCLNAFPAHDMPLVALQGLKAGSDGPAIRDFVANERELAGYAVAPGMPSSVVDGLFAELGVARLTELDAAAQIVRHARRLLGKNYANTGELFAFLKTLAMRPEIQGATDRAQMRGQRLSDDERRTLRVLEELEFLDDQEITRESLLGALLPTL